MSEYHLVLCINSVIKYIMCTYLLLVVHKTCLFVSGNLALHSKTFARSQYIDDAPSDEDDNVSSIEKMTQSKFKSMFRVAWFLDFPIVQYSRQKMFWKFALFVSSDGAVPIILVQYKESVELCVILSVIYHSQTR